MSMAREREKRRGRRRWKRTGWNNEQIFNISYDRLK